MKNGLILFIFPLFFFIIVLANTSSTFASTTTSNAIGTLYIEKDVFEISYKKNEMMKIHGTITNPQSGTKITIVITVPDGNKTGMQIFATNDGYFETYFSLDDKSQKGTYELFASHNAKIIGALSFIVKEDTSIKHPLTNFNQAISKYKSSQVKIVSGSSTPGCEENKSCFDPFTISVNLGDEITWMNDDTYAHTVTSGDIEGEGPDGIFDSSLFGPGKTFSHTFTEAGTFNYFCMIHPWMTGIVNVDVASIKSSKTVIRYGTELSLEVKSGSSYGNVRVKPSLTYNSGTLLSTSLIQIYVDRDYKKQISSNQWSEDIWVDSGKHKIEANFPETLVTSDLIVYLGSSDTEYYSVPAKRSYDTNLSLNIRDGSSSEYIQVYPGLTYGSGNSLTSSSIRIYVDGNDKGTVSSNQWSGDIWAGFGSHTIKSSLPRLIDSNDNSIIYESSSDTESYFVQDDTSLTYVIVGVAVAAGIGIAIAVSKRKKTLSPIQVSRISSVKPDDTQFYGCPTCNGDTQIRYGKQYCPRCKVYL